MSMQSILAILKKNECIFTSNSHGIFLFAFFSLRMYIAQTPGSIHIAPLYGFGESVIASNLNPPPGVFPQAPFPGLAPPVDISGPPGLPLRTWRK